MLKRITFVSILAIIIILMFSFLNISKTNIQAQKIDGESSTFVNSYLFSNSSPQIQIIEDIQEDPNKKLDLLIEQPKETNDRIGFIPQN